MELQAFRLGTFAPHLGTRFDVRAAPGQTVALDLTQARDLGSTDHQDLFALTFHGPLDRFLPQHTYPVSHPTLGEFSIFLVPVGRTPAGFEYEAVFNNLVSEV